MIDDKWLRNCEICKGTILPYAHVRLHQACISLLGANPPPMDGLDIVLDYRPKHIQCSPSRGQYVFPDSVWMKDGLAIIGDPLAKDDRKESGKIWIDDITLVRDIEVFRTGSYLLVKQWVMTRLTKPATIH